MFDYLNNTFLTTTIQSTRKYYVKNPFDSWYVGGILFMCTVILVLLYANYYRENTCHLFWIKFLTKIRIIELPPSSTSSPSCHRTVNSLLV
jgi:hypothetical protein